MKSLHSTSKKSLLGILFLLLSLFIQPVSAGHLTKNMEKWELSKHFEIIQTENEVLLHRAHLDGQDEEYLLQAFNADVVLAISGQESMEEMISRLSDKYSLSTIECRRKLKHTLNVLEEWQIVVKV